MTCLRCGSDSIIPDVRVIDRGESNARYAEQVGIVTKPDALVFKNDVRVETVARVCADCGFVETYAVDPETLWQAHLDRIANGWTA